MSDIITALKRLERAGSEDSRETQKLLDAAAMLGEYIAELVPLDHDLPRGYAGRVYNNGGQSAIYLGYAAYSIEAVDDGRDNALRFAADVANGLLDELADWLEARTAGSAEAGATLRRAAECLTTR